MKKRRKLSYAQSIGLFVLISVLPLYLFFIWVYRVSYTTIHKELLTSISLEGEKIVADLDRDLTNLSLRLDEMRDLQCSRRVTLEDSLIYSFYEIVSAKQELAEITTVVLLNSQVLDTIELFFPRTGSTYKSGQGWSKMDKEQHEYLSRLLREPEQRLAYMEEEGYVLYRTNRRAGASSGTTADIVMKMRISEQRIAQLFSTRLSSERRNIFLLKSDTGDLVASTNSGMAGDIVRLHADGAITSAKAISLGGAEHYALVMHSSFDVLTLCYVVSSDEVSIPMSQFTNFLVASLVLLVLVVLLLLVQSFFFLFRPVQTMLKGFAAVEQGDLTVRLEPSNTREFDALIHGFNDMAESLCQLIDQRYKLRMLAREAELRQLYTQINPHFLYNCFFTVESMLEEENYDCCIDLVHLLGEYLQYMTKIQQTTCLSEELRHANAYAEIQRIRFSERVNFLMAPVPEGWEDFEVPRLILQPLLENSFKHGINHRLDLGTIQLRFIPSAAALTIIVENDGDGLSPEDLEQIQRHATVEPSGTQGIALYNISSRIKLMGAAPEGLSFSISPLGGLAVSLTLHRDQKGLSTCTESS